MPPNLFEEVLNDAKAVEEKLLGPNYKYYANINTPSDIGMSSKGTIKNLTKDVGGLIAYVELLVSGTGDASKTGRPLGNKFFLQTGAKCKDVVTGEDADRYIYIDNVPTGNIPFLSGGLGINFSDMKGLIPGTISNLNVLNPFAIMQSFLSGSKPDCQEITMETIDVNNNISSETHFLTTIDLKNMDPCIFPDRKNPVTDRKCVESFENIKQKQDYEEFLIPDDPYVKIYFLCLATLTIYIFFKISIKAK